MATMGSGLENRIVEALGNNRVIGKSSKIGVDCSNIHEFRALSISKTADVGFFEVVKPQWNNIINIKFMCVCTHACVYSYMYSPNRVEFVEPFPMVAMHTCTMYKHMLICCENVTCTSLCCFCGVLISQNGL